MARLQISLLGPFQAALDGKPVTGFESNKVRALLTYLAVEADRPHPRETLAGLLWPDYPNRSALSNLRSALPNLRQVIDDRHADPPFLFISRNTIQFNTASDYALDVDALQELYQYSIDQLEEALANYRGSFLEGFSLPDSAPFEEWSLAFSPDGARLATTGWVSPARVWDVEREKGSKVASRIEDAGISQETPPRLRGGAWGFPRMVRWFSLDASSCPNYGLTSIGPILPTTLSSQHNR